MNNPGAFAGLMGGIKSAMSNLRPAQGAFQAGPSAGVAADATGGGWDANWKTAFAHPNNRMRQGAGQALMGIPQMFQQAGTNMGGFDPSILQRLASMQGARR